MQTQEVKLIISFSQDKGVQVQGPIQDKMLCYAMLEAARDAIKDYAGPPLIEVPRINVPIGTNQHG